MAAKSSSRSSPLGPAACEQHAKKLEFIEDMTMNAGAVQERVLAEILSSNANTEYLKRYKLDGATDRETFQTRVPLSTYESIQPDIQRIASGDRSAILCAHPISEFLTSSGTSSGERKLIPTTQEELDRRQLLSSFAMPIISIYVPGLDKGKALNFLCVKSESKTPGGLPARPAQTSFYKSVHFVNRPYDPYNVQTSPNAAVLCPDSHQSMYVHMLCGLYDRLQVLRIGAIFASGLLRAIRFLQLHWPKLANDIATGTLTSDVTDPSVRDSVSDILTPNPELAQFITAECSKNQWAEIITRIWPNTKYLTVIVTGTMAQYIPTLEYYSGGLPMASMVYGSSEGYFGVNLKPLCKPSEVSYTIIPNMAYFEFLPLESSSDSNPKALVDLFDVQIGKEYELIVTTYAGLYRYRVGDVLRVTGFHNSAPQFQFVRRKNVLLSVDSDKTDEVELQKAVERASEVLKPYGASVVEYTSQADTKAIPGHYVIYWELLVLDGESGPAHEMLETCCLELEEALSSVYRQCRVADGSIGPLEIRVVRSGTFERLMDYALSRGASLDQYKVPRCVHCPRIIEMLDSRVVSVHFSPELPKWAPA